MDYILVQISYIENISFEKHLPQTSPAVPTGQLHVVLLKGVPPFIHSVHT